MCRKAQWESSAVLNKEFWITIKKKLVFLKMLLGFSWTFRSDFLENVLEIFLKLSQPFSSKVLSDFLENVIKNVRHELESNSRNLTQQTFSLGRQGNFLKSHDSTFSTSFAFKIKLENLSILKLKRSLFYANIAGVGGIEGGKCRKSYLYLARLIVFAARKRKKRSKIKTNSCAREKRNEK